MNETRVRDPNWLRVFAIPICLAVASSFGFAAAFLFAEVGRYLSWLGIGLPIIVIACAGAYGVLVGFKPAKSPLRGARGKIRP
jgi:amino acid permease